MRLISHYGSTDYGPKTCSQSGANTGRVMRKMLWTSLGVGFLSFVLRIYSYVKPEFFLVLLSLVLFSALVVCFIGFSLLGVIKWRATSSLWSLPGLICLVSILCFWYAASPIGQRLSDTRFRRHLAEYSRVVDSFKSGAIACQKTCNAQLEAIDTSGMLAHTYPPESVGAVWGERCDDGGVALLFLHNTDVLLLHEGYIFRSYGQSSNCNTAPGTPEMRWGLRHVTGQWYRFSDQPGF